MSKLDTIILQFVCSYISKSRRIELYIIIMKPLTVVAGGNHLPAICYAQTGGMAYLEIIIIVKNIGRGNR